MYIYIWNLSIFRNMGLLEKIKEITRISGHTDIESARSHIVSNIDFRGPSIWILAFAIIIASVGLNVNSIPVIIGAMLISPLMGPIMGVGLALGINDTALLKKALYNMVAMTAIGILASTLFFLISPLSLEEPTELLARTNPTIYDVFIALFGGFAAIMEVCRKERGSVIAGAAIATALMPPLCTAGYGVAHGSVSYLIGACYLYFINSVFIALATFLTVRALKFPLVKFSDPNKQKRVNRSISAFTIILILPSIYSAFTVIKENNFNQTAKQFIEENRNIGNSYIYNYQIKHNTRKPSQIAISIAGEALSEDDMTALYSRLEKHGLDKGQLTINQSGTFIPDKRSEQEILKGVFEQNEQEIQRREALIAQMETQLKAFNAKKFPTGQVARELAAQYPQLLSITLARGEMVDILLMESKKESVSEEVVAVISLSSPITDEEKEKLGRWLAIRLEVPKVKIMVEQ